MLITQPRTPFPARFFPPSLPSYWFCFHMAATFSVLRDHNCSSDAPGKNSTVASTALRQVIGFNPSGKGFSTLDSVVSTTFHAPAQRTGSARGPISPRSALQDLLAAAREGVSSNGIKPSTWGLPEKPYEVKSEARLQAGSATDGSNSASAKGWQSAKGYVETEMEQALQPLYRKNAIGFATVLVESSDKLRNCFQNVLISDAREYRNPHASSPEVCRQKQHRKKSLFLRLATSPSTSDKNTDPTLSMDFLNSCYLCRRRLTQERDVFMYNGDEAFCSEECRYQQIVMDERKEKGPPAVIRSGSVAAAVSHHQTRCKNHTVAAA